MTANELELLDALADMVNQHCQVEFKGNKSYVHDGCISANEYAFSVLESHGVLTPAKRGKGVKILHWDRIAEKVKEVAKL